MLENAVNGSLTARITASSISNSHHIQAWRLIIDHFTLVCLVAWPLNEIEAGVDLVLIEISLLFLCKFLLISMRAAPLTLEKQVGFCQNKVNSSLTFIQRPGKQTHNCKMVYCQQIHNLRGDDVAKLISLPSISPCLQQHSCGKRRINSELGAVKSPRCLSEYNRVSMFLFAEKPW